jgi:hypothetical protein
MMHLLGRHLRDPLAVSSIISNSFSATGFLSAILMRMWKARTRLLRQSYWSRGWIVQEVLLAEEVVVIYGGQFLNWESLIQTTVGAPPQLFSLFSERHLEQMSIASIEAEDKASGQAAGDLRQTLGKNTKAQLMALGTLQFEMNNAGAVDLAVILYQTLDLDCSVKQDKVLCLLGMIRNPREILEEGQQEVTAQDILKRAAAVMLPSHPDFVLQCGGIGYPRSVPGLPTWVPDWSAVSVHQNHPQALLPTYFVEMASKTTKLVTIDRYRTGMPPGDDPRPKPTLTVLGAQLTIHGTRISRIKRLSSPCLRSTPASVLNDADLVAIIPFEKEIENPYPHCGRTQTAEEAFARTLVGDKWILPTNDGAINGGLFPAPSHIVDSYRKWKLMVAEQYESAAGLSEDEKWFRVLEQDSERHLDMSFDDWQRATEYYQQLMVSCKRVGLTLDGHVCLVPHRAQLGDQIVVVPGIHRPIILRPCGSEQWELVGSCFVHGIMGGEIWEGAQPPVVEVFNVR